MSMMRTFATLVGLCILLTPGVSLAGPICNGFWDGLPLTLAYLLIHVKIMSYFRRKERGLCSRKDRRRSGLRCSDRV